VSGPSGGPHGLAVIDKPAGWTSHDVVARARKVLGTKKVGHSGTLDPDATGVLLLGVGKVTRLLRFLGTLPKSYECDLVLGLETSTLDAAGEVTASHEMAVTPVQVAAAAERFVGHIEQVPPMVSAVKVDGRRLHELARQGLEVERTPRQVTVHALEVAPTPDPAVYRLTTTCSSGTYVRTLGADIGAALGGGAHIRDLRRTAIGPFTLERASPLGDEIPLLPPVAAVDHLPRMSGERRLVATGRKLPAPPGDGPWAVVDGDELLAVYERRGDEAKPAVVLATEPEPGDGGR
jgi:tRNA pseudouridine55 synthase